MRITKNLKKFALFGALPLAIFFVVLVIPFSQGIYLTFTDWDGFDFKSFVGFDNYVASFEDETFWATLQFTGAFVIVSLVVINAVAFGLALIVTTKLRSANLFRTFFFIPNLIGGVVLGAIWQFIFNSALPSLSYMYEWPIFQDSWLNETDTAFWALIIVTVWQQSGYMMIIYITCLLYTSDAADE